MSNILFRFLGDASGFVAATGRVGSGLKSVEGASRVASGVLAAAMTGMATSAIYAAGAFEQTKIAYETMLGSASDATKLLADLTDFAAKTPFEMPEIQAAARGLVQFGERGAELMESLNILGNAAAGTSQPFGMLAEIFNQVRGVGKLLTQDFRQLSTRGVLSLQDIATHFKVTTEAAQGMLSGGKVSFDDLKDILRTLSADGGRFANLMERQSKSFLGLVSTVKDEMGIELRKVGEELLPTAKMITEVLQKVIQELSALPGWFKSIALIVATVVPVIATLVGSWGAVTLAMGATKAFILGPLAVAFAVLKTMALAAVAALGPLIAGALAIAAGAYIAYHVYVGKANKELERQIGLEKKLAKSTSDRHGKEFNALVKEDTAGEVLPKMDPAIEAQMKEVDAWHKKDRKLRKELSAMQKAGIKTDDELAAYKALTAELAGNNSHLEEAVEHARKLVEFKEKLAEIPPDAPPDPELVAGLRGYTEELKEQIKTLGMSKEELKEYEYAQKNIGATLTGELKKAHLELAQAQANSSAKKYLEGLKEEAATIGLSGNKLKEYKLAQEGVNVVLQDEIKLLHKRNELVQLMTSTKDSLADQFRSLTMTPEEIALSKLRDAGANEDQLGIVKKLQDVIDKQKEVVKSREEAKQKLKTFNDGLKSDAEALAESLKKPWEKAADTLGKYLLMLKDGLIDQRQFREAVGEVAKQFWRTDEAARSLNNYLAGTRSFNSTMEGITGNTSKIFDQEGYNKAIKGGKYVGNKLDSERNKLRSKSKVDPVQSQKASEYVKTLVGAIQEVVTAIQAQDNPTNPVTTLETLT